MDIKNKNLKSPKDLFEERRLQSLMELERQKSKEIEERLEELKNRKVLSPKNFFNEKIFEVQEEIIQHIEEEKEVDLYQEQISELKSKIEEIENSLPEEVDLTEVLDSIEFLKNKLYNLPKQKDYTGDIDFIRTDLVRIERSIPVVETFDPSDLYKNISLLKGKIDEVRSEIPTIPEPILYDDQLEELKTLVENVRSNIPVVPEIKYYDSDLKDIVETIDQVRAEVVNLPKIKHYDNEISLIESRLEEIQKSIPTVPEIKYYDEDVENLKNEINEVRNSIPTVPEVRYYDEDVKSLKEEIEQVKESIPTVPKVKYYDEDVKNLQDKIEEVRSEIPTVPEVKYYDDQIVELNEEVRGLYNKVSSIKVPNEDVYFQKVKDLYNSFEDKNHKLLEKINYLEEIFQKFNENTILKEELSEPPEVKTSDPLTPLNQNFVTLDQLQEHYKLFINRIQQQLSTIGGGGETRLKYLDDIVGIATNASAYDGKFLKYNHSIGGFEFVTVSGGGGGGTGESYWTQSGVGIVTTSNVGVNTDNPTSALTIYGDVSVSGIITAADYNSASDIRLKENVNVIDNPLDKIVKLEGVNFQWKESGKKSLGVIAQEVEKVLPELVSGEETKTVNYNGIIGLLIECVKEQQKEIEELKKSLDK